MKKSAIFLVSSIFLISQLSAQQDSVQGKNLKEVVITGEYKPQSVKSSVYQVKVISGEQIRRQSPAKLQDALNTQLNIRFSQDLATGGSNINMLGLSGQNVKILIDGVPMVGRQGTSNEININQIEVNSIERIEIIEGPMSVIYGADALGGVINIITRKAGSGKYGVTARLHEETIGKEYGIKQGIHNQYLGLNGSYKNWYASGGIGRNLFNGWKGDSTGRELTWHKKDQIVANAVVGYRAGNLHVYYRLDGLDEIITNPANITSSDAAVDQDYMTNRLMQQVQASYKFSNELSANAQASYTHFTRQVYSTLYYPDGDIRLAPASLHSLSTFNGWNARATAVYKPWSNVSFQPGIDINTESGDGDRLKSGIQRINDYAFFLTSEITPVKRFYIKPGVRFIHNSVYDAPPVVPSLNIKYGIARSLDLRLAYARGFRAPSLRELYYDFFDASHSIKGNPDLKAEHSNSFTGSLTWSAVEKAATRFSMSLGYFHNDVENMIGFAVDPADATVTTYLNIENYKSRGINLNNNLRHRNLDLTLGFGYTGRLNEYAEVDKSLPEFEWSAEINSVISYAFPKAGLDVNLFYKYTGKLPVYRMSTASGQNEIVLSETEGYHWADFTVNKKLFRLITLNAGIRNLLDVTTIQSTNIATSGGGHSNGSISPIGSGRSYFVGVNFNWNKN